MPRLQMSYICRKGVMCQDYLTDALPIVSPSLCLLSRFLANNGNGKLSLGGYFVHQQSVIQHLWRLRAPSVNVRTIRKMNSWPLRITPAHSRVGEGGEIRSTGFRTPGEETPLAEETTEERAARQRSYVPSAQGAAIKLAQLEHLLA